MRGQDRPWTGDVLDWRGRFDMIDRGNLIPPPRRPIPIWVGGFSDAAFRRGITRGDGFMYAGDLERIELARSRLHALAEETGRDLADFGEEAVIAGSGTVAETVDAARRWQELGGSHFAVVSMNRGRDSVDAHLDFFHEVREGWADG